MIVGFTGTEASPIPKLQISSFQKLVQKLNKQAAWKEFHHGNCIGWDILANDLIVKAFDDRIKIVVHPPLNEAKMAICTASNIEIRKPKPYLERDWDIAHEINILVACPHEMEEILRSGVWATVRYARQEKIPIYMVWPNGHVEEQFAGRINHISFRR